MPRRRCQRFELEATYISLASNVVAAAIQEASTRAQLKATREIIAHNEKSVAILRDKFKHGYASAVDLATQELQLAQARSQLPPLQKQFEQNRDLIRELVGNLPDQDVSETFELDVPQVCRTGLPLSLPSKIIEQRPDIRAAEESHALGECERRRGDRGDAAAIHHHGHGRRSGDAVQPAVRQGRAFLDADRRCLAADLSRAARSGTPSGPPIRRSSRRRRSTRTRCSRPTRTSPIPCMPSSPMPMRSRRPPRPNGRPRRRWISRKKRLDNGYGDYLTELAAAMVYQQAVLTEVQARATRLGDTRGALSGARRWLVESNGRGDAAGAAPGAARSRGDGELTERLWPRRQNESCVSRTMPKRRS